MTRPRTRLIDRLLALLGLVVSSPVLAAAAVGIKLSGPGPVFHRARRVGLGGKPFTMYKLRTMRLPTAEMVGARITAGVDPRVFALGRCLRRLKIDELPQLVNVVRSDMAIVGPRPEDPSIVESEYAPWMRESLEVLPGLTSPGSLSYYAAEKQLPADPAEAEVVYLRDLLPRKLATDLVYVRGQSARYDAMLVLRTILGLCGVRHGFAGTQALERRRADEILNEVAR